MKVWAAVLLMSVTVLAGDKKSFPGQAGNDNVELAGTVMLTPAEIQQAVGSDLGPGIVVVRLKATNKTDEGMRIGPADFTLISRKDGDRGDALPPGELAGGSVLVVRRDHSGRDWAQQTNQPGFVGVAGMAKSDKPTDTALLAALRSKQLPDEETKSNGSIEGLMYFSLNTHKLKAKDVSLIYKGAGGHLTMDFK
jgi:hypothetical protein